MTDPDVAALPSTGTDTGAAAAASPGTADVGASPGVASVPPLTGPGALRRAVAAAGSFAAVVELVPWAGELGDPRGERPLAVAADLAGDPRITALSVTDNAGGHARLSPDAPAEALQALGHDVIVHVAARDRNRAAIQSLGWDLLSRGLTTVLAITGDYPVQGYRGVPRPVFDVDSVVTIALLRELGAEAARRAREADEPGNAPGGPSHDPGDGRRADPRHDFLLACAVDPFKRLERDLVPQLLKLRLKAATGADLAITQVGYDARKADELLRWLRQSGIVLPVIANAYILSAPVARAFHAGRVAGVVVPDALLERMEREAASPDRGRAFALELAAKQAVVARGLGFAGIYLSGHRDAEEVARVLELAAAHDPLDWRSLVRDVSFGQPGAFHLFEPDGSGLATDEPSRAYARSRTASARAAARARAPVTYRINRLVHDRVFASGTAGFRAWGSIYERAESMRLGGVLHVLEQAVKVPLYDCRDCGDCSLPEVAYLCPESHCQKNQRNGPCGGSRDGRCEVAGHACVWAEAYRRLKPYGEELSMLDRPPVIQDNALRRSSAWANTFLGRDHVAIPREKGRSREA